jgi:DNA-binding transcriptional MerR regulator
MLTIGQFARLGQVSPRMLRHYDELGLLRPAHIDPDNGYRFYGTDQLVRLHRLVALRDLGFGLDQIAGLLDADPSLEELRGMLRLRRAELAQQLEDEQARLRRVDAHLRAIERSNGMSQPDVVIKRTQPLRVAEAHGAADALDPQSIGPVFMRLAPAVSAHVEAAAAKPGLLVGYYDDPAEDGSVGVHVCFEIGAQPVSAGNGVAVVDLPVIEVASVIHHGAIDEVTPVYEALLRWIDDSGYRSAGYSRELYHELGPDGPRVTELQLPITR